MASAFYVLAETALGYAEPSLRSLAQHPDGAPRKFPLRFTSLQLALQTFFCGLRPRNFASQNQKDLLLGEGENKPHPGDAASGGLEPFEENHNASLMWQIFLCGLRPRNFASQNQKDLVLRTPNLFSFVLAEDAVFDFAEVFFADTILQGRYIERILFYRPAGIELVLSAHQSAVIRAAALI